VKVVRRPGRVNIATGGRALTACERDVRGWTPGVVFNDELYSRADLEEAGGWTLVDIVV
jgi:hypothetical protein